MDNDLLLSWELYNKYPSASRGIYPFVFLQGKTQKAPKKQVMVIVFAGWSKKLMVIPYC